MMVTELEVDAGHGTEIAMTTPRHVLAAVGVLEIARAIFYLMLMSFIAEQFLMTFGYPAARTQSIMTFAMLFAVLRPIIGWANDRHAIGRYRRKNMLFFGIMLDAASILMLLSLPGPATASGLILIVGAFMLYGAGDAFLGVGCDALALDVGTTTSKKNSVKAVQRMGAMAGLFVGYIAGAFLVGALWTWFLVSIGIAIVISAAFVLRIDEPAVPRVQARPAPPSENDAEKTNQVTLWIFGALAIVSALAGSLTSIQYEPFLIARYGNATVPYYLTEFLGAVIALVAMAALLALPRIRNANLGTIIIPSALVVIAFYICLPWLAPTLFIYLIWTTAEGTGANLFTFGAERVFMDVVRGKNRSGTYQVFQWFTLGGGIAGNIIGSMLGMAFPYEALLVLSGGIDAVALLIYVLVLAPRLIKV